MAGIENIVNEILADAKSRADEVLDQARKTADEELAAAAGENAETAKAASERAARAVVDYEARVRSQCEQENKLRVLAAKQEVIDGVLAKAEERLKTQDAGDYFDMLRRLLATVVRSGEGEIALSASDLSRVPEDFLEKANAVAKEKGGSLSLSDKSADIDSGFILRYGQIEENCSLSALFAENRDRLQDVITSILW